MLVKATGSAPSSSLLGIESLAGVSLRSSCARQKTKLRMSCSEVPCLASLANTEAAASSQACCLDSTGFFLGATGSNVTRLQFPDEHVLFHVLLRPPVCRYPRDSGNFCSRTYPRRPPKNEGLVYVCHLCVLHTEDGSLQLDTCLIMKQIRSLSEQVIRTKSLGCFLLLSCNVGIYLFHTGAAHPFLRGPATPIAIT